MNNKQQRLYKTPIFASMSLSTIVRVEVESTKHSTWVCTNFYFLNSENEIVFEFKLFGDHGSDLSAEDMIKIFPKRALGLYEEAQDASARGDANGFRQHMGELGRLLREGVQYADLQYANLTGWPVSSVTGHPTPCTLTQRTV